MSLRHPVLCHFTGSARLVSGRIKCSPSVFVRIMCTALLSVYRVLLSVYRIFGGVYRALLSVYRALLSVYRVLLRVYRALLRVYRVLLSVYRILLSVYRALSCEEDLIARQPFSSRVVCAFLLWE